MRFFFGGKRDGIEGFLRWLRKQDGDIRSAHTIRPREPSYDGSGDLDPGIVEILNNRGIEKLWSHQSNAYRLASSGRDIVVVTPTASGKTFCYDIPVVDSILRDPTGRALYLFPTKALAQDQLAELEELCSGLSVDIKSFTYDGDTPASRRKEIINSANIVITNPDMLNTSILPHHRSWAGFFSKLKFIVVDELHTYRGVFGSHIANIFVRLLRICRHYGSDPVFICCSATIANPAEHAALLTGRTPVLIDQNGAPSAQKELIIYDPVITDKKRKIRRSSLYESGRLAYRAISCGISSILFTRSRINAELLVENLKRQLAADGKDPGSVRGYRSGYLPAERRETEKDLRSGKLRAVVSTNALELGIDIGSLDLVLIHGFPGSIASTWQQIGRAGRRNSLSAAVIIPSALPADRFLAERPEWLLGASPERARIDPKNPYIRIEHIKCSIYELPFREDETFGGEDISDILGFLFRNGIIDAYEDNGCRIYSWKSNLYPASSFSIRSASGEKYDIIDTDTFPRPRTIGTVDRHSAASMIFPGAVYFHNGTGYSVEKVDHCDMKCFVRRSCTDTYTEAKLSVRTVIEGQTEASGPFGWGDTRVTILPGIYKIIDIGTRKTLGHGKAKFPNDSMETTSLWIKMPAEAISRPGLQIAMDGAAYLLKNLAPLFLMCDSSDIYVNTSVSEPGLGGPAIFLSDAFPGGVGLAEGAYGSVRLILTACRDRLASCGCRDGCPSCIGHSTNGVRAKDMTKKLLNDLLEYFS